MSVFRSPVPAISNIAELRLQTSGSLLENRVYLYNTNGSDEVASYWYLINGSYDGTYDDGAMHIVDADGRLWAREFNKLLSSYFGIVSYQNFPDAAIGSAYHTQVQQCLDFWADPNGQRRNLDRNGSLPPSGTTWNVFKGWNERPKEDRYGRECIIGDRGGYVRISTTVYVEPTTNIGATTQDDNHIPLSLTMASRLCMDSAVNKPCVILRRDQKTSKGDLRLRTMKFPIDIGGGAYKVPWANRTDNADVTLSRYPQIARPSNHAMNWISGTPVTTGQRISHTHTDGTEHVYTAASDHTLGATGPTHTTGTTDNLTYVAKQHRNRHRNWVTGMALRKNDLVTHTHSDGSEFLYKADSIVASHATEPTHPSGTVANLLCVGEYVTPYGHSYNDILGEEQDCGVIIESLNLNDESHIFVDGWGHAVQCMVRPLSTEAKTVGWAHIHTYVAYGCKFGTVLCGNFLSANQGGWINDNNFYHTLQRFQVGATFPVNETGESIYGVAYAWHPDYEAYKLNNNKHHNLSQEETVARTNNAELAQYLFLQAGENCKPDSRNDNPLTHSFILCENYNPDHDAKDNLLSAARLHRAICNGAPNKWHTDLGSIVGDQEFYFDLTRHVCQGGNGVAANRRIFFDSAWETYALNSVLNNGMRYGANATTNGVFVNVWDGQNKAWNIKYPYQPVWIFDLIDQNVSEKRAVLMCEVTSIHVDGSSGSRLYIWNLKKEGGFIAPSVYPKATGKESTFVTSQYTSVLMQDSYFQTTAANQLITYSFGIPERVNRIGIGVTEVGIQAVHIRFHGTRKARLFRPLPNPSILNAPEMGMYRRGQKLNKIDGTTITLTGVGSTAVGENELEYHAVRRPWASGEGFVYHQSDLVYTGTKTSATVWAARLDGTSGTGTSPADDNGMNWDQVATGIRVCVPSDWT